MTTNKMKIGKHYYKQVNVKNKNRSKKKNELKNNKDNSRNKKNHTPPKKKR